MGPELKETIMKWKGALILWFPNEKEKPGTCHPSSATVQMIEKENDGGLLELLMSWPSRE